MKFIYKQNYIIKLIWLMIISLLLCLLSYFTGYVVIPQPINDIASYHSNILTINSIFSGFALTNLGILISITDDQLIKKLEGTDILRKRNIVIGHSIIFGAVSIFISMFWVLKVNISFLNGILGIKIIKELQEFFYYLEVFSLIISILYFLLSIKKMIELLELIHVPKQRYSEQQIEEMKNKINKSEK